MRQFILSLVAMTLMCLTFPSASFAEAVHGVLRVVKGNVQVKAIKDGKTARAKVGQKVFPQDTIITGPDSRAKVVMIDNNEINVSPDSEVAFEKYEYKPGENKKDVLLNVIYGKVRSKVEQKYDGKTTKFQVKTPSAVAGVRGTDFITGYDLGTKETSVVTFHGAVEFKSSTGGQAVMVNVGQSASATAGKSPSMPAPVPPSELKSLDKESKAETATPGLGSGAGAAAPGAKSGADDGGEKKESAAAPEKQDTADSAKAEPSPSEPAPAEPAGETSASAEPKKGGSTLSVDRKDVPEAKPEVRAPATAGAPAAPESPRPVIVRPNVAPPPPTVQAPAMPVMQPIIIPDVVKDIMQNTGPAKVNIKIVN